MFVCFFVYFLSQKGVHNETYSSDQIEHLTCGQIFKATVSFKLRLIGSAMFGVTFNLVTRVELP